MAEGMLYLGVANKERFLAAWIDSFLSIPASMVVASYLGGSFYLFDGSPDLVGVSAMVGSYLAYYFLCEGLFSATPGKFLFGLRVKGLSGNSCTWQQAGIRTVLRPIEVNPLLLGALPAGIAILATKRKQRLGDLLAETVVVSSQ